MRDASILNRTETSRRRETDLAARRSSQKLHRIWEIVMSIRALTLAAVAAFSLAACSEAEQDEASAETAEAGEAVEQSAGAAADEVGDAAAVAGDALAEEASQLGAAVKSGVSDAAEDIDQTTDRWAAEAEAKEAREGN